MKARTAALAAALLAAACSGEPSSSAASPPQAPAPASPSEPKSDHRPANVRIEMRNVRLHVADGIVLNISFLRGVMVSRTAGQPPIFDDQRSYVLHVHHAEIAMDTSGLQALINQSAIGYEKAPLENVEIGSEQGRLVMKGTLRKGVKIPFSTRLSVGVTDEGQLRLHAESMKAAGVPAKGLMNLFGLELDDLVALKNSRGIDVRENDIVISPGQILPPPEIRGRLTHVTLSDNRLVQSFGEERSRGRALTPPAPDARNYIYFGGGNIRFGKLTMSEADLQLIDMDPRDPFEFDPAHYNLQLVAGYSKNTPQKGLKTYMPDIDDLGRKRPGAQRGASRPASRGGP